MLLTLHPATDNPSLTALSCTDLRYGGGTERLSVAASTVGTMTGVGVRWTAEEVLTLAPDEASRKAGSRLSRSDHWSDAAAGSGAVWGLCKGSSGSAKPYRTVVDLDSAGGGGAPGCKCSCPSRKYPCKHVLGLLLLCADGQGQPPDGHSPPEWAGEWLSRRRERARRGTEAPAGAGGDGDKGEGRRSSGPQAAQRRAERRTQRVAAGATELEERLADLLRGGLAGAEQSGPAAWEETAARMVDAQAPGLAARIRELGALPSRGSGGPGGWPERLLSECALLHLLNQGFLALESLPEPLAATVRTRVGFTVDAAEVLAGGASRVRDEWLVLARRDTEEGRLTARRTWLRGHTSGRLGLLLSYAPLGRQHELALPAGSVLDAELAYYPAARPLRAALGERHAAPRPGSAPPGGTVTGALAEYGAALCDDPWLDAWPTVLSGVVPVTGEGGLVAQLADAEGEFAVPVAPGTAPAALWRLLSVAGGAPVTVFGECGHRGFAPYTAWSGEEGVVPL